MSALIFSLEAVILAVLGMAWQSFRGNLFGPAWLEDFVLITQGVLAVVNLAIVSIVHDPRMPCRSYFTITVLNLLLLVFLSVEASWPGCTWDNWNVPNLTNGTFVKLVTNATICCPNYQYSEWNKHIFFNGFNYLLAPVGVTLGFQFVQTIIAAGALSNTQHTLYPGASLGFGVLILGINSMLIKFSGFFTKPCLADIVELFDGFIIMKVRFLFLIYVAIFLALGAAEDFLYTKKIKVLWAVIGSFLFVVYAITVQMNLIGYNLISYPWMAIHSLALLLFIYSILDVVNPTIEEIQTRIGEKIGKQRTRFVLPMQAKLTPLSKSSKND